MGIQKSIRRELAWDFIKALLYALAVGGLLIACLIKSDHDTFTEKGKRAVNLGSVQSVKRFEDGGIFSSVHTEVTTNQTSFVIAGSPTIPIGIEVTGYISNRNGYSFALINGQKHKIRN